MTYAEKLKDPRWQKKRLKIFERDNFMCRNCCTGDRTLIIHHACYLPNREPWDYPDSLLYTLCEYCHENLDSEAFLVHAGLLLEKARLEKEIDRENFFDKNVLLKLDAVIQLLDDFWFVNDYRG